MSLYKKFLWVLALFALGQARAEPAKPVEGAVPQKVAIKRSNLFVRTLAASLCIPENQLTLRRHCLNSLPLILTRAGDRRLHFGCFVLDSVLDRRPSLLPGVSLSVPMGIHEGFPESSYRLTYNSLVEAHQFYFRSISYGYPKFGALAYLYVARQKYCEKKRGTYERQTLLARIRKSIPCIESRSVPESIKDSEYIMIESPLGYSIRNAPDILDVLCTTAYRLGSAVRIFPQANGQIFYERAQGFILRTCAYARNIYIRTLCQIPWAKHVYILKSDLKKLSVEDQQNLYRFAKKDAFDAVITINNALQWACVNLNDARIARNKRKAASAYVDRVLVPYSGQVADDYVCCICLERQNNPHVLAGCDCTVSQPCCYECVKSWIAEKGAGKTPCWNCRKVIL